MLALPLLLLFLRIRYSVMVAASNSTFYGLNCTEGSNNTILNTNYHTLLSRLLDDFISNASITGSYNSSMAQSSDRVYGLYMCRGDIDGKICSDCVREAKDKILRDCPNKRVAFIWYDKCLVRYSDKSFFGQLTESPKTIVLNTRNITENQTEFTEVLISTMNNLAVQVANDLSGTKFFGTQIAKVSSSITMYALQQCAPDLSVGDCYSCLKTVIAPIEAWHVELCRGVHIMLPSCNVQYEIFPFFQSALPQSTSTSPGTKKKLIYILVPITLTITILLVYGTWISMQKRKAFENSNLKLDNNETIKALQFDVNQIRSATRNFSVTNRLGEGGFGVVYKGILDDGQEIALKRLSDNSGQGILEFKTEVVLLAELRHKNLVKLLGFCLASNEKILVYEYLPNSSLDQALLDPLKKSSLNWAVRFKIIVGIARGLMYLHEESRLKIIHRDLKSSNILLDGDMNPKIADFGLAKLFGVDQTRGDTKRIVGTYGYMAPEYATTGHFSVKSDVYSFGVIVLEILSGKTNGFFSRSQLEETLQHHAWRLWNEGNTLDLIDNELGNDYPTQEVSKCIHISLLCVQEVASERPKITTIVAALDSLSVSLPLPKPPTYFGKTVKSGELVHYNQMTGEEIEYEQAPLDESHPSPYTGAREITNIHPR